MEKSYRKPIPIYKFGDNLRESDTLERQRFFIYLKIQKMGGIGLFIAILWIAVMATSDDQYDLQNSIWTI